MSILESFKRLTIDSDAGRVEVETMDGKVIKQAEARLNQRRCSELPRDFSSVTFIPAESTLTMTRPNGEALVVEVFQGEGYIDRRAGRPVAYLDQTPSASCSRSERSYGLGTARGCA